MKATDLTIGLSSGAYPADVLPSQIYDPAASGEQKALHSSLVDEIRTAAKSVSVGYSRIIRLCRRISQAVQGCTKGRWSCLIAFIHYQFWVDCSLELYVVYIL